MVRVTNAVASMRKRKRLFKRAKGFWGDRKNHKRQAEPTVLRAMAFSTQHRKLKKRQFRSLWIVRISAAAKSCGISYSRLIDGLTKSGCAINRKMLADIAVRDFNAFKTVVDTAKAALVA